MKNFVQFCLAAFTVVVFGLRWPVLWAEIALTIFAVMAIFGKSKKIAVIEVLLPIVVIIIFHQKPNLWLICLIISGFLAVWNIAEWVSIFKEKLK